MLLFDFVARGSFRLLCPADWRDRKLCLENSPEDLPDNPLKQRFEKGEKMRGVVDRQGQNTPRLMPPKYVPFLIGRDRKESLAPTPSVRQPCFEPLTEPVQETATFVLSYLNLLS